MVQPTSRPPWRRLLAAVVTAVAALLVVLPLAVADPVDTTTPADLLRLPLEPLVLLAAVLAVPAARPGVRTALAVAGGGVLGVVAVLRGLDLGFLYALNRPFDPLIDWRYGASLASLMRDSFGPAAGTALLAGAVLLAAAALVVLPLAALRVARAAARHRRPVALGVAVLLVAWVSLAAAGTRGPGGAVASDGTSRYAYHQVARIPVQLRDLRDFDRATRHDPMRAAGGPGLLAGLRGKDVLVVFVESYGRVALRDAEVRRALDDGDARLAAAWYDARSAWLTSPTFGALSWLAHSTLQSGLRIDSQQRYDALVTSSRLTLSRLFARAGWRTVVDIPADDRAWQQAGFYDYDRIYDSRNVGYRGPRFGYPTMPDQYTLAAFDRLELAPHPRRPVFAEIDLITSHAPWSRTPRLVPPGTVGDGSVFDGMPAQLPSAGDIWPDPARVRAAYGHSVAYSLRAVSHYLADERDRDLVVVLLGDHQPATIVSGHGAGHDVPVTLLSRDPAVLRSVDRWGWTPGLRPPQDGRVWPMEAFRDRFLDAFDAGPGVRRRVEPPGPRPRP